MIRVSMAQQVRKTYGAHRCPNEPKLNSLTSFPQTFPIDSEIPDRPHRTSLRSLPPHVRDVTGPLSAIKIFPVRSRHQRQRFGKTVPCASSVTVFSNRDVMGTLSTFAWRSVISHGARRLMAYIWRRISHEHLHTDETHVLGRLSTEPE